MTEIETRAFRAYFRMAGPNADQPSSDSGEIEVAGKQYVALRNVNGVLAVYRIKNNGALRRLIRWPAEIAIY
jgi:hypothetical protein